MTKLIFSLIFFFAKIQKLWERISSLHPQSEQTFEMISYTKLETQKIPRTTRRKRMRAQPTHKNQTTQEFIGSDFTPGSTNFSPKSSQSQIGTQRLAFHLKTAIVWTRERNQPSNRELRLVLGQWCPRVTVNTHKNLLHLNLKCGYKSKCCRGK